MLIMPLSEVLEPEAIETPTSPKWTLDNCSCVQFLRSNSSIPFERINTPHDLDNNYPPSVGGMVLLSITASDGRVWGHMGLIINVFSNGVVYRDKMLVTLKDGTKDCVVDTRFIRYDDSRLDGFRI